MFELGVRQGQLDLPRLVELLATRPAQLFGLAPQKGEIAPGADADIVIFLDLRDDSRYATVYR